VSATGVALSITGAELLGRSLPLEVDPKGTIRGTLEVPVEPADPLNAHFEFNGSLLDSPGQIDATLQGELVKAELDLGPVPAAALHKRLPGSAVQGETRLRVHVDGTIKKLKAALLLSNPAAELVGDVELTLAERLEMTTELGISSLDLAGLVQGAPASELDVEVRAKLLEQGDGTWLCEHEVDVVPGTVAGQATPLVEQVGTVRFGDGQLHAQGELHAQEPGLELRTNYVVASTNSQPSSAELTARVHLSRPPRLSARGVDAWGTVRASAVYRDEGRQVSASLNAELNQVSARQVKLNDVKLSSKLRGSVDEPQLDAHASFVAAGGRVRLDTKLSRREQRLALVASNLAVRQLQSVLAPDLPHAAGTLSVDADVRRVAQRITGFVQFDVPDLRVEKLGQGNVHARVTAGAGQLDGTARVAWGKLGHVELVAADIPLSGRDLEPFLRLTDVDAFRGRVQATGKVHLAVLQPFLVRAVPEIETLSGRVAFELEAQRPKTEELELSAAVDTSGLRVVQKRTPRAEIEDTETAVENEPLALEGLDFNLAAKVSVPSDQLSATLIVEDRQGALARLRAKAKLPPGALRRAPTRQQLNDLPLEAELEVPWRRFGELPPLLRPTLLRGSLSAHAALSGTFSQPSLQARVSTREVGAERSHERVDVNLDVRYEPEGGQLEVNATEARRNVAHFGVAWQGDVRKLGELGDGPPPVTADAELELSEFPTAVIPMLKARQVEGALSGNVKLDGWGKTSRLAARMHSRSLSLSDVRVSELEMTVSNSADRLEGQVHVRFGEQQTDLSFTSKMRWGDRALPTFERDVEAKLTSRDFELATLHPLIGGTVSELSGKLDANARLRFSPNATEFDGDLQVNDGILQVPTIGQRFTDVNARVVVGDQRVRLEELNARGPTGRVRARGSAEFAGTELRKAEATLKIAEGEKLPVTLEGQALGDAWGDIRASYEANAEGARYLEIDVRRFTLITPESGGHGLQGLDDAPDIRVGTRNQGGEFAALPIQQLASEEPEGQESSGEPLRIRVKLGNVRVDRGNTASARLGGQLDIIQGEPPRVTGRIELKGGQIDVQGKRFEIERGVVTFDGGDPSNPTITATARWDSPTDHVVYAEYIGDVENGRIKLRSEPPLSNDEIASLLLFGNTDGSFGSSDGNQAALAVSVAGSTVTKGLNQVLADFSTLDVSTRIDTSTGSSRPEVVIQVTPRLAAKVTRAVGEPTAGESPDRTFLTLELRLKQSWALSALLGDRGASALDLIWRRRY
jgi:autotransporter translocation and assembly factor TamB